MHFSFWVKDDSDLLTYFHLAFFWNFSDLITLDKIVFNLRKSVWSSDFSPYKTTKHKSMSPQFVPSPLVGLWPLRSWCPEECHRHRKRLIIILENPFFQFQLYYYTFILFKPLYVVFSSAQTLQLVTYYTTLIFISNPLMLFNFYCILCWLLDVILGIAYSKIIRYY